MRYQLELFFTALGFFTRLPVPGWVPYSAERLQQAPRYLPLVGLIVGSLCAGVWWLCAQLWSPWLAVLLSLAFSLRLTGCFHEDGWADSCDGLGGGWEKSQILAIMKDSRIGSYGVAGLGLMLATKAAALVALGPVAGWALLLAHPLSRGCAVLAMQTLPYVRDDASSKSAGVAKPLNRGAQLIALTGALLPWALITLPSQPGLVDLNLTHPLFTPLSLSHSLTLLLAPLGITLWAMNYCQRRLGGYTGDLLGAIQQLSELSIYLAWAATLPAHY